MTKTWDDNRKTIIRIYKDENKPLHEVRRIMEEEHQFKASTRAYRSRFVRWGIRKYTSRKRPDSSNTAKNRPPSDDTSLSPSSREDDDGRSPPTESPVMTSGDYFGSDSLGYSMKHDSTYTRQVTAPVPSIAGLPSSPMEFASPDQPLQYPMQQFGNPQQTAVEDYPLLWRHQVTGIMISPQ
ncbi:Clr5 domain-containing protein [Podospora didyma]|uniref:Clr5 domain-containing protein n=1 Tax=Podospora didyma TaxID=330526 RepID=A0AAE0TVT6_9PEZI|nr:Clr5 domain-containing protein [Podospora didyma]